MGIYLKKIKIIDIRRLIIIKNTAKDFPKERYTTLYPYVKSFFNHNAFEKMALLVMIHI